MLPGHGAEILFLVGCLVEVGLDQEPNGRAEYYPYYEDNNRWIFFVDELRISVGVMPISEVLNEGYQ